MKCRRQSQSGSLQRSWRRKGPLTSKSQTARRAPSFHQKLPEPVEGKGKQSRLLSARSSKPSKKCALRRGQKRHFRGSSSEDIRHHPPSLMVTGVLPGGQGSSWEGRTCGRSVCRPQTRWRATPTQRALVRLETGPETEAPEHSCQELRGAQRCAGGWPPRALSGAAARRAWQLRLSQGSYSEEMILGYLTGP